ncbi:cytochrome P450 76A2-like [Nicotiana tomentosiformis]|uniref:cytochrome P450 76A2-like n=1 Tax=Nicotiana tomentosiformis TaxID=4098 RepID=UPI00388CAD25
MVAFAQATETRKLKNRMEHQSSSKAPSTSNFGGSSGGGGGRSAFRGGSSGLSQSVAQSSMSAQSFGPRVCPYVDLEVVHNYNSSSLALAPYGTYWRMLRRICTTEMFTNKRINETVHLRRKCIDYMLQWIDKEANSLENGKGVEVSRFVYLASFNMIGNLMLSHDLVDPESKTASDFFTTLKKVIEWSGRPNISDIYPCLKWLDLQGLRQKSEHDMGKAVEVASAFVKERMKEQKEGREKKNDFVEVLLEFEGNGKDEPAKLSEHQINIFILEMFIGESETTSSSSEWALTELLHNPEVMTKVKAELSEVVGNRKLEESDIDKLHYMQAVIKGTLRLHPPIPFLLPRRAVQDTRFMGYDIPEDTQVFVNVWAIGRDPEFWEDPLAFRPERFLCSKIDFKGQCYEFIPFGAGRKMCVGLPLANRILHLALGSLLQEFDWELPENITPNSMDMTEKIGITVRKVQPLKAVPIKRRTSYSHKLQ